MSLRVTTRVTGAAKNTVVKLLTDLGAACAEYQDGALTNLDARRFKCDEIWSFCYAKQRNVPEQFQDTPGYGDVWTWTALDADTKPVPSWLVGERTTADCYVFLRDLRSRLLPGQRIQLSTDGFGSYPAVVDALWRGNIDYAQIIKEYDTPTESEARRYSPAKNCTVTEVKILNGDPEGT